MTAQEALAQVRAEIEKRQCKAEYEKMQSQGISAISYNMHLAEENAYLFLLDFLDSIQVEEPEVDLEKAFTHEYAIYHLPTFIIASIVNGTELIDFIYETARHFYELGLNARKEK